MRHRRVLSGAPCGTLCGSTDLDRAGRRLCRWFLARGERAAGARRGGDRVLANDTCCRDPNLALGPGPRAPVLDRDVSRRRTIARISRARAHRHASRARRALPSRWRWWRMTNPAMDGRFRGPQERHMIGRLNHVAIAVRDIAKAANVYRRTLGAKVSDPVPQPEHGVTTVFTTLPNTKIELLEPLGEASPIAKFLERNPDGGIHHVCYEVDDIGAARDKLKAQGARVLGDGEAKIGAHGKPVLFLHPKDFCGTLVEIEQA